MHNVGKQPGRFVIEDNFSNLMIKINKDLFVVGVMNPMISEQYLRVLKRK